MCYLLTITETGRNSLKEKPYGFNEIHKRFRDKKAINEYLVNRYGKMPGKRHKIYIDNKDGECIEVGFLHSFWSRDWSHNSKNWFQTDWITLEEVTPTNFSRIK